MSLRRPSTPFLASIAVHVLVVGFFVQALVMQRPLFDVFNWRSAEPVPVERIGFLALPPADKAPPAAGRRGGNGRPETKVPAKPIVSPPVISSTVVTPSNERPAPVVEEPGTGPLIGGGGPLRGVQPRYGDPRLWGRAGPFATAPKTAAERLDSVIVNDIGAYNDSMRVAAGNRRDPTDWTVERNGRKYGIDRKFIRIGPISIPTAVLAMIPVNVSGNPTTTQRERSYNAMHDDIMTHAQGAMNDIDFNKAVKSIRIRKDRERKEREQAKAAEQGSAASKNTGANSP